jgi:hypothetical protein
MQPQAARHVPVTFCHQHLTYVSCTNETIGFDMNSIALRRGLFRIWAVLTALFIIAVILTSFGDIAREFQDAADGRRIFPSHPWWHLMGIATFTIILPLAILIVGGGIFWIWDAFADPRKQCQD